MGEVEVFDINSYLQEKTVRSDKSKNKEKSISFNQVVNYIRDELNKKFDDNHLTDEELAARQELEHNGTLGIKSAENMLITEIETILRKNNLLSVKYPSFYDSISQAIFQEIYRFGPFYKWESFRNSPSAIITGKEIWFKINGKFIKQEEEMRDENHIDEIIRLLQMGNSSFKLNEANPEGELILKDGVRIKVMIPPLSNKPTIVFRRFVVNNFSFVKQAEFQTIPKEDIHLYEMLSKLYLNTIIAGHVESGKSTLLKTIYSTRDTEKVAVLIESSPETFLKRDFPNRLVHELYTDNNGNIHDLMRSVLRIDHDYVIVQEVRGIEAEGALTATERGTRGTLMTYHITDPVKTPEQLAQHITDEFPNRNMTNEIRRVAMQLDLGITMETLPGNKKKLTSVYEICYDFDTDSAWINYLVKYDKELNNWFYNAEISKGLIDRMYYQDLKLADKFFEELKSKAELRPIVGNTKQPIHFK